MKFVVLNKKMMFEILAASLLVLLLLLILYQYQNHKGISRMVMGGQFHKQSIEDDESRFPKDKIDIEKYFRPSKLPVINNRNFSWDFWNSVWKEEPSKVDLPDYLLKNPEDTIINYFSILREAANPQKGKVGGCGTLGQQGIPYPGAYNFLSSTYQAKVNYSEYLKSFENILHINLIKLEEIITEEKHPNCIKYFIEIETIEGSEKDATYFAYYYGYLYIIREGSQYKISHIELYGENYLCAPYHGWSHIAEAVVDIKYGEWCSLVKKRYPTQQDGYVKKIRFKGTDGNDYLIEFFQLTNGTDIEIAQYKKNVNGRWEIIKLDPNKCSDTTNMRGIQSNNNLIDNLFILFLQKYLI